MPALSTCWNNSRHNDGEAMVDEILELGFDTLELSHGMTVTKLPGLRRAYQDGRFKCVGVHNYFPAPTEVMMDAPDAYEFTSHRPFDRQRAWDLTVKTLEVAAEFDASYLVLHMGSDPLMPHKKWTGKLTEMLKEDKDAQESKAYTKLKAKCLKKRTKSGVRYFGRAMVVLEKLAEKAEEFGVPLAIESRSRFEDVPNEEEMVTLQEHFKDNRWIGYWHDFGHVQLKHNLGLLDHDEWLGKMEPYILGAHVHDVHWPHRDHRVPFTGTLDYQKLLAHIPKELPHVWELSPRRKPKQILQAIEIWKKAFPER